MILIPRDWGSALGFNYSVTLNGVKAMVYMAPMIFAAAALRRAASAPARRSDGARRRKIPQCAAEVHCLLVIVAAERSTGFE